LLKNKEINYSGKEEEKHTAAKYPEKSPTKKNPNPLNTRQRGVSEEQ